MDGWNDTIASYWVSAYFSGANLLLVSGVVMEIEMVQYIQKQPQPAAHLHRFWDKKSLPSIKFSERVFDSLDISWSY